MSSYSASLWPFPRLLAHRGGGALAPENTLAGLRLAARLGYAGVEFDVKLTADGHPILMHDPTLERTTDGKGKVAETTLAAIRALDAGSWFGGRFAGEKVPTLEEALEVMSGLAMGFNLEIKPCPGREAETAQAAAACVRQRWPRYLPQPIFSSFKAEALAAARAAAPEIPRGFLFERLPAASQPSYLSGLVIGEELRAQPATAGPVTLIASAALAERYALAFASKGVATRRLGAEATWRGLWRIAQGVQS